ncbi:MAG: elongation factor G [Candidatus Cloacimonadota bacterium]|nr:elongation factor G [Candidatus Cloacimonadota bacterium]
MKNINIEKIRNTGICAHIDAGKTTLTERILFYANRIHKMQEVKSKDGNGPVMDSMELERERGITISSATTNIEWKDYKINIIDTPGHIDFTIEVENALRILDGAVLVICAVNGVQTQTFTVEKQLERYEVPYLVFINKLDRSEAKPFEVVKQLEEELGTNPVLLQIPIGKGENFSGVIDLVSMKMILFEGNFGEIVVKYEIPEEYKKEAKFYQDKLIDSVALHSEELTESYFEGNLNEEIISKAILKCTLERSVVPVYLGSAYKNTGVQLLLNGIIEYLPNPTEKEVIAYNLEKDKEKIVIEPNPNLPTIALAFKIQNNEYGQLTYLRIYQGMIEKGCKLYNNRDKKTIKVPKIVKMHATSMEKIEQGYAGDIVAVFGVDCAIGDTFTSEGNYFTFRDSYIPEPLVFYAIKLNKSEDEKQFAGAVSRFMREDPTFKSYFDAETKETIIAGLGELHLDIYLERLLREYGIKIEMSSPRIAYKEKITATTSFSYTHKKQSGGRGQFAKICGEITPSGNDENVFEEEIKDGAIPSEFISACEKSFFSCLDKGELVESPIIGTKIILNDGGFHEVDSSPRAFEIAIKKMFKKYYQKCKPSILEPIMNLSIVSPSEFRGNIITIIRQNRGDIKKVKVEDKISKIESTIPLSETFGITKKFRSSSQGKAEFNLSFKEYSFLPKNLAMEVIKKFQQKKEEY